MFIIVIETYDKNRAIGRLSKLKSTIMVEDGGMYHMDKSYSQIWIESKMTEDELDHWLWKNGLDYVGVVTKKED